MYDDKTIELQDRAIALIIGIRQALKNGTKHYRKSDNCLLKTDREILHALIDEGEILLEPKTKYNPQIQRTQKACR